MPRKVLAITLVTIGLLLVTVNATPQTYADLHDFNCAVEGCQPILPSILAQGRDGNLYGTTQFGGTYNRGTVFRATPDGTVTTLYNFDGPSGSQPQGGLTLATDGNFYGTTAWGGSDDYGVIFRITPSGTLTVLHQFDGYDGQDAYAPPIQAGNGSLYGGTQLPAAYRITLAGKFTSIPTPLYVGSLGPLLQDNYLYGTDQWGGPTTCAVSHGCVFRMSVTGAYKTIYDFDGTHGDQPYGPLAQLSDGNLYGTTVGGGALGGGVAFKLTKKGAIAVLRDFDGSSDGGSPSAGLVAGSDGNLYGANARGGAGGVGTLFRLTRTGTFSLLGSFDGSHGAYPGATPMQHTNGTIYGLTQYGGAYNVGVLYSLNPGLPAFLKLVTTSGTPGQTVQILGQGFNTASSVKVGSGSATFTAVSDTFVTAVVPAEGTTGYVTVTTATGTLTSNKQYKVRPTMTGFSPGQGSVGTNVTITGAGFGGATKITFGGIKATSFAVNSGSQITVTVPVGAMAGKIVVTTPGGNAPSKAVFTVI